MRLNRGAPALFLAVALALPGIPGAAAGQSTTTGVLEGTVRTVSGVTLSDAQITITRLRSGLPRVLMTDAEGRFSAPLLQPGEYEVRAEQLGYQPVIVGPVPVRVGRRSDVVVTLERVEGVVQRADRVPFSAALVGGSRPGRLSAIPDWERAALSYREGDVLELLRSASSGEPGLEVEGLPSSLSAVSMDGVGVPLLGRSLTPDAALPSLLFPIRAAAQAELIAGRQDVEWPSVAGGVLALTSRSGSRGLDASLDGDWSSDVIGIDEGPERMSWRAGATVGGALAGDSAHVWVDVQALEREKPATFLPSGSGAATDALVASGLSLGQLQRATVLDERISASATFDWSFADGRSVRTSAHYAEGRTRGVVGSGTGLPIPATAEGTDMLVTTAATAGLSESVALQFRLGFGVSTRDQSAAGLPATRFGEGAVSIVPTGIQLGGDGPLPAELRRSGVDGQGVLHFRGDDHHVKLGIGLTGDWHEQSLGFDRGGRYLFGSAGAFDAGLGARYETDGGAPTADFSTHEYFIFGQDTWRLAPGLDLVTGLRYELEVLPTDGILRNPRWLEITGIDNSDVDRTVNGVGFVAGFEWDVQEAHEWLIRAGGAVHTGDVLPDVLTEGLTHDGRIQAFGHVGDVDDDGALQALGPRLTILSSSLEPPVTTRASFGLTRALDDGTALHLGAVLRETGNLPRRRDLNLRPDPGLTDQYDRPLYGPLEQAGAVLQAAPGENRRFAEFDAVSSISSDASSTYWGVTAAVERQAGPWLRLTGRYTYSQTRDDWVDPAPGQPFLALSPFPTTGAFDDWQESTSYFDVPHRAVAAFEVRPPVVPGFSVGGIARVSSGRPFTPDLGQGVDVNADGVSGNDPAFVDATLAGMQPLLDEWACLRSSAGRFVDRNGCRTPTRISADAWLAFRWPEVDGFGGELRVEALGLVSEGAGFYDTALLGVDPGGTVTTDPATGRVTVPLVVNPRFGQQIIPGSELSRIRISMRLWY